jgi:hypothetical protein
MDDHAGRRQFLLALGSAAFVGPLGTSASAQEPAGAKASEAKEEDVSSLNAILGALYDVISGPAGAERNWDRMRSLFVSGARLIPVRALPAGRAEARILSVDDYIKGSSPYFAKNGFFEREVARRVDQFGHLAHVFSTYESRHAQDDPEPFARGINSIQLLQDGKRWWVVTIFWDAETPDRPIPQQYLPK